MSSYHAQLSEEICASGSGLEIKNRRYLLKTYPTCFVGSELIDWLVRKKSMTRPEALALGNELVQFGYVVHVVDREKPLLDGYYFYIFTVFFLFIRKTFKI